MERHCDKRLLKAIKVNVYHNGIPVVSCKTRDIGVEGIFIETGPLVYKNNTHLKIEFEVTLNKRHQLYRLSTIVAYSSEMGHGLYIVEGETQALKIWCKALQNDAWQTSIDEPGENLMPVFAGSHVMSYFSPG